MNRFGDIDISSEELPPVDGYHTEKLVSLEKALKPIESHIAHLLYYIKLAKSHCHYPSEHGLSKDESAAIYIYAMDWGDTSLNRILNKALRSKDRHTLKIWFPYLKLFETALDKLPTVKDVIWRGLPLDISRNFMDNQVLTWWTINSCSLSLDVIKHYLLNNNNNKTCTVFLIEAMNGKNISGYTQYENEQEVILHLGTQLRVKYHISEQSDSTNIVHLIEIDEHDDEPLIVSMSGIYSIGTSSSSNKDASVAQMNANTKWKRDRFIIAGGNGEGNQFNQLFWPQGICMDDENQCIYIADWANDRIIEWKLNSKIGQVVAGGNGCGNRINQLNHPTDVIVDKNKDMLIICDWLNNRIVQWSRQSGRNGQVIIPDIDCSRLTMDNNGDLYVSDWEKNEVRRYKIGESKGIIVAGGNGKGDHLNQFNYPTYIFVDQDFSVYVSDEMNHRVMKWVKDAKEGIIVAGGNGNGNSLTQLSHPQGIAVDHLGNVYVADSGNDRIMCWSKGGKESQIIIGGTISKGQHNLFDGLGGLSIDRQGNLYVVDCLNSRIHKFDTNAN